MIAVERFAYDAALNLNLNFNRLGADEERVRFWQLALGGQAERVRGPLGETIAPTYDAGQHVVERRVERDGFRPKTCRYGWDAHDRLVSCLTLPVSAGSMLTTRSGVG